MRRLGLLLWSAGLIALVAAPVRASEAADSEEWQRVDSRYCTIWIDPSVGSERVFRRISVWRVQPQVRAAADSTLEEQLAAKFDTLLLRVQGLLDMYPPGIHIMFRITRDREAIDRVHRAQYGSGVDAQAIYLFEINTVYADYAEISESVVAHEMAHAVIDHYFGVRPPRKVEEMLAIYVDENLRE